MLEEAHINDPAVRDVAEIISIEVDEELERLHGRGLGVAIVEIALDDGTTHSCRVDNCKGNLADPMSFSDLEEKFWGCVPFAAKPLDRVKLKGLVRDERRLDELSDMSKIVAALV